MLLSVSTEFGSARLCNRAGVVSRQYYDLDAVLEFDALDDFGQLVNRRHVFAATLTSLNTMSLAVLADRAPLVRMVR